MYGLRRSRPDGETSDSHIQIICRVPRSARSPMLEASGVHALMVRDFVEASTIPQDTTVLPKFLCPTTHNLHDLLITSKGVPGAAGIILARRGLALRVWACHVAKAREIYMADDRRITKDNAHVVPRHTYESSGWPTSIEAPSVIHAVKEATGSPPIPTRAYRAAGVYSWTLAFQDAPSTDRFIIEVGGQLHEVLLVPTQQRYNPKTQHREQATKAKKQKALHEPTAPQPITIPLGNPQAREDTSRLDRLEARVGDLETKQTNFERRFDERLDGVDSALRQLLQRSERSEQARQREPTGDTPPPKHPRAV